jgi:all-trans-8'-apo-beta-carotenal 15,15'-oxygenase
VTVVQSFLPFFWATTCHAVLCFAMVCCLQDRESIVNPSLRTEQWHAGTRRLVNEPLFVPKPNATTEDEGWLLATIHNAASGKGELVILDAQRISEGPVATVHLPHHLPAGLHGSFSPQVLLKGWEEAAARNWQDANAVQAI